MLCGGLPLAAVGTLSLEVIGSMYMAHTELPACAPHGGAQIFFMHLQGHIVQDPTLSGGSPSVP